MIVQHDPRLDPINEWLRRGCPEKLIIHYNQTDYVLEHGILVFVNYSGPVRGNTETPKIDENRPNKINNLQTQNGGNNGVTRGNIPVTPCAHCGKPSLTKFCKPSCKTQFYRKRRADRLLTLAGEKTCSTD